MSNRSRLVARLLASLFVSTLFVVSLTQLGCSGGSSVTTVEAPKVDPKAATARPPREVTKDTRTAAEK